VRFEVGVARQREALPDLHLAVDIKHAYCEACDRVQPVTVEPPEEPDTTGRYRGGDMVCTACGFVICTVYEPITAQRHP